MCRQLGYGGGVHVPESYFGQGTDAIWLDNVRCYGNESTIVECSHNDWGNHNCVHFEDVGVICGELLSDICDGYMVLFVVGVVNPGGMVSV